MKIILVFGGSGFIGSRLVDELKGDYKCDFFQKSRKGKIKTGWC